MIPYRQICRMSHLAARFVGGADVHVVDPLVDLRNLFEQTEKLKNSVDSRKLGIDVKLVEKEYNEWFDVYSKWKLEQDKVEAKKLKREMKMKKDGLIKALELPNMIYKTSNTTATLLKSSKHAQYLTQQGLMRIDKESHVVHLVGFPCILQRLLRNQLTDLFPSALLLSPSYFARAAIIEALNLDKNTLLPFTDGSDHFPETYIVGNSLASLVTPFVKTQFSDKNKWPIAVQCSGASYSQKRSEVDLINSRQRMKHSVLFMMKSEEELETMINEMNLRMAAFLDEGLYLELNVREAQASELKNYESQAYFIENRGLALARVSRIGDYISKRLNICHSTDDSRFVQMVHVETDIDRVMARMIDDLIDGREPPKIFRDALKRSK